MKITHLRSFFAGLLCLVLALACAVHGARNGIQTRHVIGLLLLLAMGSVNFWFALSKTSIELEIQGAADERDLFIATRSGHMTLQIMNILSFSVALLAFLAYGFTRQELWLAVGVTLMAVVLTMFLILLGANCYYEKKF